jgi:hypothetical protein
LKNATTDKRTIAHWWSCFDYCNVGLATGQLVALDVDPRHHGDQTLRALEDKHGALPQTWRAITGGGGEHVFFTSSAAIAGSAGTVGQGLDIRGADGYVVAPPSLHKSGRRYEWNVDFHPDDIALAPIPDWLVDLAGTADKKKPKIDWAKYQGGTFGDGTRNTTLASLTGYLLRRYVAPHVAVQLVHSWNLTHCSPPLDSDEVEKIIKSIASREAERLEGRR